MKIVDCAPGHDTKGESYRGEEGEDRRRETMEDEEEKREDEKGGRLGIDEERQTSRRRERAR